MRQKSSEVFWGDFYDSDGGYPDDSENIYLGEEGNHGTGEVRKGRSPSLYLFLAIPQITPGDGTQRC